MASLRLVVLAILAALALSAVPSAYAIVDGELDSEHDYVVFIRQQAQFNNIPVWRNGATCSGTLVDANTVVTAAHCSFLPPLPPGATVTAVRYVVFQGDSEATATASSTGTFIRHPDFCFPCAGGPPGFPANNDLAVIELDTPLEGPYANLPKEGWVGKHFESSKQLFVLGFGLTEPFVTPPPVGLGSRRLTQSRAHVLVSGPNFLELPVPEKDKYGVACSGDSGGANLVGNTLVAVTSIGDNRCGGPNYAFRIDTPSARAFLSQYVDLR